NRASGNSHEQSIVVIRHDKDFADGATTKEARAYGIAASVVVVTDWIDWAHQICRGVHIFYAVQTNTREAIRRAVCFACANPQHVIGRIKGQAANRERLCRVEDWPPGGATIERTIDAALSGTHIDFIGISGIYLDCRDAAANVHARGVCLAKR